jgi:DNA-binding transcriptional ArsR family regulator
MERVLVARELAEVFRTLSHELRIRIVEELAHAENGELDVHSLEDILAVSQPTVSQHLAVLRRSRLVRQRRVGRSIHYSLTEPELARWLLRALAFLEARSDEAEEIHRAVERVRELWP